MNCGQDTPQPKVPRDASGMRLQGTLEVQDTLASILAAVDVLATVQLRNVQHDQEHHNLGRASHLETSGAEGNSGGTFLKNFIALHPPEFRGGVDTVEVGN